MKTIPETFNREGWCYTLVKSCEHAAIYEMTKSGEYCEYEVWKLRYYKSDNAFTGVKAGDVKAPSTKEWGHYGWSYPRLELAEWKYGQIINDMTKTQDTE